MNPAQSGVETITCFARPITIKGIQRFLGMINYYRIFLPNAAQEQAKLYEFLKGRKKNDNSKITWCDQTNQAFERCKEQLSAATQLAIPTSSLELAIMVDASNQSIGAVVQQHAREGWQPLSFFSRKLTDTEQKYSTYDRELLAAYGAVKHVKHFIDGREFTLYTDHKPLTYALHQNPEKASPRQLRHLDFIAQFTADIRHISGKDNVVADALSRIDALTIESTIDYALMADEQTDDE